MIWGMILCRLSHYILFYCDCILLLYTVQLRTDAIRKRLFRQSEATKEVMVLGRPIFAKCIIPEVLNELC